MVRGSNSGNTLISVYFCSLGQSVALGTVVTNLLYQKSGVGSISIDFNMDKIGLILSVLHVSGDEFTVAHALKTIDHCLHAHFIYYACSLFGL